MSNVVLRIGKTGAGTHVFVNEQKLDGLTRMELTADANELTEVILYVVAPTGLVEADKFKIAFTCPCCGEMMLHTCPTHCEVCNRPLPHNAQEQRTCNGMKSGDRDSDN